MTNQITIQGARTHNLNNVQVTLPRDKLVVITGLSGSGKSSLAFDTLYAEGQRRYVESLSTYARQFLSLMEKPDVDHIEGLSPAIAIEQKSVSHNPRSTVGTITEIHDYLRLLFARVGQPHCPEHQIQLSAQTVGQMADTVLALPEGTRIMILAPVVQNRKGEHLDLLASLKAQGFMRVRINGEIVDFDALPSLDAKAKHTIEVVVDRLKVRPAVRLRLVESFETALQLTEGSFASVDFMDASAGQEAIIFSAKFACPTCGYSVTELTPRLFSFNNPLGACSDCDGLGMKQSVDPDKVIHDKALSLAGGAVRGWDSQHTYYYSILSSIAEHYGFSLETAFQDLPQDIQAVILYGSKKERIRFTHRFRRGRKVTRERVFEGVLPSMARRYRETDSEAVRDSLLKYFTHSDCPSCAGTRLCPAARAVLIQAHSLPTLAHFSIAQCADFFETLQLTGQRAAIAERILKEINERLHFLISVGLNYLSLSRAAHTLSGGEAQRIRLASQIGSGLVGVMYVLDEPSIGLHQRDNQRLLDTLVRLRELGNTVIVVEHDEEAIRQADYVIDMGPGAGVHGGDVVAAGTPQVIEQTKASITGQYLSGQQSIAVPKTRTARDPVKSIRITGNHCHNLQSMDVRISIGLFTCITGVSGSGKSSLINDTLYPLAARHLNRALMRKPTTFDEITGLDFLDKVVAIDQSPIGRTPRSNPATYTGLFTPIRELFAGTQEARSRGYSVGRFSFNVKGGRCEACQGDGVIKVEMHFLADIYVPCDTCQAKRYNRETLEIRYKGKTIAEVLTMTVEEGLTFFDAVPVLKRKLQTLIDVGLGYIQIGQSATTLSGGEAQRMKLSKELSKRATGSTLYILDEPTTGLHFHDVKQLLTVLHRLRDQGNTVIVIEHNLDVIKTADWIIDLGPEGGSGGGRIVVTGTPEQVAAHPTSYTGQYLKDLLP